MYLSYICSLTQQRRHNLAGCRRRSCRGSSSAGVSRWGRQCSQMTEVGVDVVGSRVVKLLLCGVHQDGHQASEAPKGEVEHKGKLEAHQQGQCARGAQRVAAACHHQVC